MRMIFVLLVLLTGCATSYQAYHQGEGFKEVQLKPNMFRVSYQGSESPIQSADFTMLRAAELTLEKGFSHFAMVRDAPTPKFSLDHHYFMYASYYVRTDDLYSTVVIVTYNEDAPTLFDAAYVVKHFREAYELE